MSRKKRTSNEPSSFGKLLGWTVVLALVFSAGLITGQRLLKRQSMPPLVSLQTTDRAEAVDTGEERLPTTFSFYEHLGEGPKEAPDKADEVAKPKTKPNAPTKPAQKPDPAANKPEPAKAAEKASVEAEVAKPAAPETEPVAEQVAEKGSAAEKVMKQVADVLRDDDKGAAALPARYTLQVGSHTDRKGADTQISKLESMGLEPHVVMVEVPERGRFYRVRIGKFHSMEEARNFQGNIQSNRGVSSFVSPI